MKPVYHGVGLIFSSLFLYAIWTAPKARKNPNKMPSIINLFVPIMGVIFGYACSSFLIMEFIPAFYGKLDNRIVERRYLMKSKSDNSKVGKRFNTHHSGLLYAEIGPIPSSIFHCISKRSQITLSGKSNGLGIWYDSMKIIDFDTQERFEYNWKTKIVSLPKTCNRS